MEQGKIFVNDVKTETVKTLQTLTSKNIRSIKKFEIDDIINKSIKDFYYNEKIKPEDIRDAQEKEQVRFYDLIKADVYNFLMSNDYEYDRRTSCFLKNKKK